MFKRMLSLLLCMVMVLSALPVQAIAQETAEEATTESVESEMETIAPVEAATEPTEEITVPAVVAEATGADIAMAAATSGTCGDNLTWDLDNGILTISGTGEMWSYHKPWEDYANQVTSLVIESGVISISDRAFSNFKKLKSVVLSDTILVIGSCAFLTCTSLESIIIPESVRVIGDNAFAVCKKLSSVTLHEGLITIESNAFESCEKLFCRGVGLGLPKPGQDGISLAELLRSMFHVITSLFMNDSYLHLKCITDISICQ